MQTIFKLIEWCLYSFLELLEKFEYRNLDLDENDPEKKVLSHLNLPEGTQVSSNWGNVPTSVIVNTQPYSIWEIQLENGLFLKCADTHIVFDENLQEIFTKDLQVDITKLYTEQGPSTVISLKKLRHKISMFDLQVDTNLHAYYTNGILSHNTIFSGIFICWYNCFNFDRNTMIVANKGKTAGDILKKVKTIMDFLPYFLKPGILGETGSSIVFDNGCQIRTSTTTKDAAIGNAIHLLYADEFAHVHHSIVDHFYRSIFPTLSSSEISRMIITSTPNGLNKFWELWDGAINGKNSFNPIRIDWHQVEGRDEQWKFNMIADIGEEAFEQEYNNTFLSSQKLLLPGTVIERNKRNQKKYIHVALEDFDELGVDYSGLCWHPDLTLQELDFTDPKYRYFISVDISDGVQGDYTVFNIFRVQPMSISQIRTRKSFKSELDFFCLKQIGMFRSNRVPVEDAGKILETLIFNVFGEDNLHVGIEYNFKGDYLVGKIESHPRFYKDILMHTKHSMDAYTTKPGIRFNRQNKVQFCQSLKKEMLEKRIQISEFHTINEFTKFALTKNGGYSAETGNDDAVITCVIAAAYMETQEFQDCIAERIDLQDDSFKIEVQNRLFGSEQVGMTDPMDIYEILSKF